MMRNTLGDLNNHLFAQLERLSDEDLKGEKLEEEINRARAIKDIATQIIGNANVVLRAQELVADTTGRSNVNVPKMLEG